MSLTGLMRILSIVLFLVSCCPRQEIKSLKLRQAQTNYFIKSTNDSLSVTPTKSEKHWFFYWKLDSLETEKQTIQWNLDVEQSKTCL